MKLAKKQLATSVNSVRPYKSRSKRPCDFCRRRKTCCIIEKLIPCMACSRFNKGACTFLEGPLKRRSRKSTEPKAKRGRKKSSRELTPDLETSVERSPYALSTLHDTSLTLLGGGVLAHQNLGFLPLSGEASYNEIVESLHHSDSTTHPLAGTGVGVGTGAGHMSQLDTSYLRDIRYPDMISAAWNHTSGRASTADTYLLQLTLSSLTTLSNTSLWLDALLSYGTTLNMLKDVGDFEGKRFTNLLYSMALNYFQPQHTQLLFQTPAFAENLSILPGWNFGEYLGGLSSGMSESLPLQGMLTGATTFSPTTHLFGSGSNEAVGGLLA